MHKKLTITVEEGVYRGLHDRIGRRKISAFLNRLAKPHVQPASRPWPTEAELDAAYAEMAADEEREAEAREWCEGVMGDLDIDDEYSAPPR